MISRKPPFNSLSLTSDGTNQLSRYLVGRMWGPLAGEKDKIAVGRATGQHYHIPYKDHSGPQEHGHKEERKQFA